jgi:hypothetical protein
MWDRGQKGVSLQQIVQLFERTIDTAHLGENRGYQTRCTQHVQIGADVALTQRDFA